MKCFKPYSNVSILLFVISLSYFTASGQGKFKESYRVETIEMPKGLSGQTGGIDFLPDGRMVACFVRGEVMIYNLQTKEWKLFAEGLLLPLGILAISNSEVLVMQLTNLMRIKDTDGDGHADLYENATSDFGVSGNYHEFNYGPVKDKSGKVVPIDDPRLDPVWAMCAKHNRPVMYQCVFILQMLKQKVYWLQRAAAHAPNPKILTSWV